jgi:hypothetical protein
MSNRDAELVHAFVAALRKRETATGSQPYVETWDLAVEDDEPTQPVVTLDATWDVATMAAAIREAQAAAGSSTPRD